MADLLFEVAHCRLLSNNLRGNPVQIGQTGLVPLAKGSEPLRRGSEKTAILTSPPKSQTLWGKAIIMKPDMSNQTHCRWGTRAGY
jgi:hypothetical protein